MSQSKLDYALDFLMEHEGGLVNHPSDPGGATNFGVSLRWLKSVKLDIDGDGDVDEDDVLILDDNHARLIYTKHWWCKYGYDKIESREVAAKVLDMSVNMGAPRAHRIVQAALSKHGAQVKEDGILGPITISYLNGTVRKEGGAAALLNTIRSLQSQFYRELVKARPRLGVFLNGWEARAKA